MIPNPLYITLHLTLYGISSHEEKIITNKSVTEWEFSKNETKNILSLCAYLCSTTNAS